MIMKLFKKIVAHFVRANEERKINKLERRYLAARKDAENFIDVSFYKSELYISVYGEPIISKKDLNRSITDIISDVRDEYVQRLIGK